MYYKKNLDRMDDESAGESVCATPSAGAELGESGGAQPASRRGALAPRARRRTKPPGGQPAS
eukprot:1861826-Ditylum_brightwellii.AAC.1